MSEKEMYLAGADREHETTLKLLKAYPADKLEFKPHPRSRTARELAWNFVLEEGVIDMAIAGQIRFSTGNRRNRPGIFRRSSALSKRRTRKCGRKSGVCLEEKYNSPIAFPAGPGKMADLRRADVFWTILMDQVHHRGQFSVYLRMAGGKVPSIYGPTADESWM